MPTPTDLNSFITAHRNDDPSALRLKFHGDTRPWINDAISHIECLRKSQRKFVLDNGTDLTPSLMVSPLSVEQATSARVGKLHDRLAADTSTVLDMTCGLGMDTLMLAADGRRRVTAIEQQEPLATATARNLSAHGNIEVVCGDSPTWLKNYSGHPFDLVFIDPARRGDNGQRVYNLHDCTPDLTEMLPLMSGKAKKCMAKLSPMLDVSRTIADLPGFTALHIVDEGGECRELLALIDLTTDSANVGDPAITVHTSGGEEFTFTRQEEAEATAATAIPEAGMWIYEPSPAAMKSGAYNLMSSRFGTSAISANTHLYISPAPIDGFPGKGYEIIEVMQISNAAFKSFSKKYPRADIATRNLPQLSPEQLQKKLKTKPGGNIRVYGTTLIDGTRTLIVAAKPQP